MSDSLLWQVSFW